MPSLSSTPLFLHGICLVLSVHLCLTCILKFLPRWLYAKTFLWMNNIPVYVLKVSRAHSPHAVKPKVEDRMVVKGKVNPPCCGMFVHGKNM